MDKCTPTTFCPLTAVTRETMADFLLKGLEGSTYTPPPAVEVFSDVPISNPHAGFIEELARRGITGGCGAGIYCPTYPVTRAQMATFLTKTWGFTSNVTPAGNKRYMIYSPEMSLIAESEYTSSAPSAGVLRAHVDGRGAGGRGGHGFLDDALDADRSSRDSDHADGFPGGVLLAGGARALRAGVGQETGGVSGPAPVAEAPRPGGRAAHLKPRQRQLGEVVQHLPVVSAELGAV